MRFSLAYLFGALASISVALAVWTTYFRIAIDARPAFAFYCAIALCAAPFALAAAPRRAIAHPCRMMLTWWIVPLTFMPISFDCVASETAITEGFFLLFSVLWAMFGPTATIPFFRSGAIARRVRPTTLRQATPFNAMPHHATDSEESQVCKAPPEKPHP